LLIVFNDLRLLLQLQLQKRVANDADSYVNRLNIVLDSRDCLLDVLERRVVTECLASVVDLLANVVKAVVDLAKLVFKFFNTLADRLESLLVVAKLV